MKRWVLALGVGLLFCGVVAVVSAAEGGARRGYEVPVMPLLRCPVHQQITARHMVRCSLCGRMMLPAGPVMPQTVARKIVRVGRSDPGGMLAHRQELGLTPEQVAKIQEIARDARRRALEVLTEDQVVTLRMLPAPVPLEVPEVEEAPSAQQ